jgi:sialate O-acetylesterase
MKSKNFLLLFLLLSFSSLHAKVVLPTILGDNMVLQQQTDAKLWGEATVHAKVTVKTSWNKAIYTTIADSKGKWLLSVKTPNAGGPYEVSFSDGETITLKNILIGEVWFCSGQSNMEMPVRGFNRQPVAGSNDILAKAKATTPIRIYTTDTVRQFSKQPQTDCKGRWMENASENVAQASAAAYFFAQYIQEVLEVPVGIIVSSWGGSTVETWMSRESIAPFTEIDLSLLDNNEEVKNPAATPCVLYNAKIAPITPFVIKGFLWYQGESNRGNVDVYARLMPAFVSDLRARWNCGEFPFYFVEIAPFNYDGADLTSAARMREVQLQNMRDIPNSGMVTTLDIGNPVFIHPTDKATVGKRLAYWALAKTYGKTGFGYVSPTYQSMEVAENKIYINFNDAERGLCPMWTALKSFEIAGADKKFYPANAEIETKTTRLAVSCEQVPHPVAVRYAYKNYTEASVFNIYGIPVAPFRTDNW